MPWICGFCGVPDDRLRLAMRHINNAHFDDEEYCIQCGIDGCAKYYKIPDSWYRHVRSKHAKLYYDKERKSTREVIGDPHNIQEEEMELSDHETYREEEEDRAANAEAVAGDGDIVDDLVAQAEAEAEGDQSYAGQIELLNQKAAIYIMGIKTKHSLTQKAMDDIKKGCEDMVQSVAAHMEQNIRERIQLDDTMDNKEAVEYHTQKALKYLHNPFKNIHTAYKQKRFIRKNWNYVDATAIVLGQHVETKIKKNIPILEEVDDVYYHVPLKESIKQFLSNKEVFNMLSSEKEHAPEGYLIDFWDGSVFKEHTMLSRMDTCGDDELILAIQLYYDDVEACNPLTNNSHNIAMFYYRLANVDPVYRSMLPAMRLIGATETKNVKEYGMNRILDSIVDELTNLHDVSTHLNIL